MAKEPKLNLIPLGGMGEIGKNLMVVKFEESILILDCGLMFPEEDMLGIDIVIPDITYLLENKDLVCGVVLSHGHEDHIGALPYVLKQLKVPVYGTKLTLGLLQDKLKEQGLAEEARLKEVKPREIISIGPFKVELVRVSHSVPDAVSIVVYTPVGKIVYTGDFKIDHTPVDGEITDFFRLAQLGEEGVLVLISDSTNVEHLGYTMSERMVGDAFDEVFRQAKERIIVATFASNIHRLQQAINTAHRYGRKVSVVGRSMINVINIACELGYLQIPEGTLVEIEEAKRLPKNKIVFLSTGSQGEPMSALTRMALGEHRLVEILPGDTIIISATPIPGNEKLVARIIDQLFKRGANVIYDSISEIHVSGHASREELKLMLNLVKPKFFVPSHGQYRMLIKHAALAKSMGIPPENVFVVENGQIIEFGRQSGRFAGRVAAGRVLIDGLGIGDVGNIVLRDRKQLSQDGIMVVVVTIDRESGQLVAGPDIVSRGFVYVRESEELMEEAREKVKKTLEKSNGQDVPGWTAIKSQVRDILGKFLYEKTRRRPMILPIIVEI